MHHRRYRMYKKRPGGMCEAAAHSRAFTSGQPGPSFESIYT